jgi:hypothetical protein
VTTTAAIHAVAQFSSPEGYPYYYPPPGFIPPMNENQPSPEGGPNVNGQHQPMVPYYIHPGNYPPFPYYPHPGPGTYPHQGLPPHAVHSLDASDVQKKVDGDDRTGPDGGMPSVKKKTKGAKNGEIKMRKPKGGASRAQRGNKANDAGEGSVEGLDLDEVEG